MNSRYREQTLSAQVDACVQAENTEMLLRLSLVQAEIVRITNQLACAGMVDIRLRAVYKNLLQATDRIRKAAAAIQGK